MTTSRVVITAEIAQALREFQRFRAQATNALEAVSSVGGKLSGMLGAIGVSLSVAAFAGWIKGAIDATDAASDLSQKTGIAIKDLAGLELAYQKGGMEAEALATTQAKLSKAMVDGNEGLEKLGISAKNLDGSFKSNKQVMYEIADRFSHMEDGAAKTALAMTIFGKTGADMIPMLNEGSNGMREMDEWAAKLGLTLSDETVEQAGAFNDTLDLLKLGGQGVARGIAAELLPTLTSLAGSFLTTMTQGDRLKKTAEFLANVLRILYTVGVGIVEVFSTAGKTLGAAGAQLVAMLSGDFKLAAQIGREWAKDIGADWSSTAKAISDAWSTSGDSTVAAMAKVVGATTVVGVSAAEARKQAAAAAKEQGEQAKILAELSGVTATYMDDLSRLDGMHRKGSISLEQYIDLVTQLIAKQPGAKKEMDDAAKSLAEYNKGIASATAELQGINEQVRDQERANEMIGLGAVALAALQVARVENLAAQKDETAAALEAIEPGSALAAKYREQAKALRDLAAAKRAGDTKQAEADKLEQGSDVAKAKELLDIMTALDEVTRSAAAGMAESFGRVGSAIGDLTTALSGYGRTQAAIAAQLAADKRDAKSDPVKLKAAEMKASDAAAVAQVRQYGDMAKAAKGFFKESTTGYKVMEGAEKAFRAYEMAMSVKSMMEKSGLLAAFTGLFVASKATETAVEGATTAASVTMAGTQASAWGITAVVKAIASLPFPWNLAAGAATLAAVVAAGAAMMGSVGSASSVNVNSAEERQKVQGTGTVLGDPTAKSESMAHSLEIMEKYAELGLGYQNSMLTALRNIETALGGAAKGILQTTGITGGSAFGTHASSDESFFGASHTKDITDSGVKFSGSFGDLRRGAGSGRQYEDVFTTSDGGMFHSGWERTDTNYKELSAEAMKPFTQIFDNMGDLMVDAGAKLGYDSATLNSAINSMGIDFAVSLRGLTGDDLTDALNAGVGVTMDRVAMKIFPGIEKFQEMGEGLGETLVRVAADVQAVDSVFAGMGKAASMSFEAKEALVQAAGGMEKFADSASSFMSNFYSDAEQMAMTKARLSPVLASVGLSTEGADAQKMFRDFVVGLDTSTEAGAKTYAMLMDVQQAFKDVTSAAADERADLLAEWDDLTLTDAQKRAKERLAIDPTNQALFDQITLQRELKSATDGASDGLQGMVDSLTATKTSTMAYLDSLVLGSLSTLTPMQKYLETQRQYNTAVNKAMADPTDSAAASAAQTAATTFLTASQVINASSAAFIGDKSKVMSDMDRLASFAGAQLTDAQRQLSALDKQTAGITQLNGTAAAIEQAILNQGVPAPIAAASSFDMQRYAASSSASADVLAAEVKALRTEAAAQREINAALLAEMKLLRADAKRNADDIVDATEGVGETVSKEVGEAIEQATYRVNNPTRVAPRGM
jgi:hypothetical protein